VEWLLNLQNRDGGVPTFCRGWGALPFDRSGADLTAHAIRAWLAWADALPGSHVRIETAIRRAMQYLAREQRPDGSWLPLWFGNQFGPDDENPIYGTARVLEALNELAGRWPDAVSLRARGRAFFWRMQNRDGSWGRNGAESGTVEETALALGALADGSVTREEREPLERGGEWLAGAVESGRWREPAPIGFYFAKLWYFERLYPAIFTVAALEKLARHWPESHPSRESA
jgi:squalene-hopene/tetraprenyl-beta-curcumene cyclase